MTHADAYAVSSITMASHQSDKTLRELQYVINAFFDKHASCYVSMNIDDYRSVVANAQAELNACDFSRRIAKDILSDIQSYFEEEKFLIQTNLYLRATRPSMPSHIENIGWHRESFYGPNMERSANVWTPIANVTKENTLRFVPASQHIPDAEIGIVQGADIVTVKGSVGNKIGFLYAPKTIVSGVNFDLSTPMNVPLGRSAIFPGELVHGSAENHSDRIRFSCDFRILPASAYDPAEAKNLHFASGKPYFEFF